MLYFFSLKYNRITELEKEVMQKVSFIVQVFNLEKYVGQGLETLINQTIKNIEILLVNYGSTVFTVKETQSETKYYLFDSILVWKGHKK